LVESVFYWRCSALWWPWRPGTNLRCSTARRPFQPLLFTFPVSVMRYAAGCWCAALPENDSSRLSPRDSEVRNQRQMIGSSQRQARPKKQRLLDPELVVEVDVVEIQQRDQGRISPRARHVVSEVGQVKLRRQRSCDQAVGPLVEIAQHDSGSRNIHGPEEVLIDQAHRLCAAFAVSRAEMDVEDMEETLTEQDIGSQYASPLPPTDAEINMTDPLKIPAAQSDISVHSSTMFPRLAYGVAIPEAIRQITGLMVFNGRPVPADNFLKSNNIGFDRRQHAGNTFHPDPAVESPCLVDVISGDP
jgi:hypothetical protein